MFLLKFALLFAPLAWSNADTYFREKYEQLKLGSQMVMRAYDIICWYEYMKLFPPAQITVRAQKWFGDGNGYKLCAERNASFQRIWRTLEQDEEYDGELERGPFQEEFANFRRTLDDSYFPTNSTPEEFHYYMRIWDPKGDEERSLCYARKPNDTMLKEYSTILDDAGKKFNFKNNIHCWLQFLITRHGAKAIKAIKEEKLSKKLPVDSWRQLMLERENQFRKLHKADPLELDEGLNAAAQEYATYLEKENKCEPASCRTKDKCIYNGTELGENICIADFGILDLAGMPYICPAQYYGQKHHYDHQRRSGRFDTGGTRGFEQGSYEQFAQMLWRPTKKVGYGYVSEDGKGPCKGFILVSKYFPLGGQNEKFSSNDFYINLSSRKKE